MWLLVVRGSFRNVEKVLLALSLVFVSYIITAFAAKPDWLVVGRSLVTPSVQFDPGFFALAVALTGTTIAPWMQFFVQSNIVDKGTSVKEWALAKWDVIAGAVAANIVAIFIIVTTATVLFPHGIAITAAAQAAQRADAARGPVRDDAVRDRPAVGVGPRRVRAAADRRLLDLRGVRLGGRRRPQVLRGAGLHRHLHLRHLRRRRDHPHPGRSTSSRS